MSKDLFLIKRLLVTDKAVRINLPVKGKTPLPKYVFLVKDSANKNEIKKAVKELYRVDVLRVNTINIPGRMKRSRTKMEKEPGYKKAVVTLKEGQKIEERKS
jgi:large subunit ribosomal protein L23